MLSISKSLDFHILVGEYVTRLESEGKNVKVGINYDKLIAYFEVNNEQIILNEGELKILLKKAA